MKKVMSSEERINTAINLGVPDRVPIFSLMIHFAARHTKTPTELFFQDKDLTFWATEKTFNDFGGWDAIVPTGCFDFIYLAFLFGMKMKYPGVELPSDAVYQLVEEPIIFPGDYDLLAREGWPALSCEVLSRIRPDVFKKGREGREKIIETQINILSNLKKDISEWQERDIVPAFGGIIFTPFNKLSLMRSMNAFTLDLYREPDRVLAALEVLTEGLIQDGKRMVEATGVRRIFIADHRSPGNMLSLKFFERFSLPFLKRMVEAFAAEDIISILHFDSDWTKNLPFLRALPAKKAILMLDGYTDIFKAKEILGNHMCIMGDVPPSLLTLGTPEQVADYVKRLIDEVGKGGGYILCTGCELPIDAKEENYRTMLETAKSHGVYG